MKLTLKPDFIQWPRIHYVYVEKIGPFQETAQKAWETLHKFTAEISKHSVISGYTSLYKIEPQMIYRAGVIVNAKPSQLPEGFQYTEFHGGKYARFVLTGSYSQLPEACGQVFGEVEKTHLPLRDDFFIENYVNSPATTPEDQLITEILLPAQ